MGKYFGTDGFRGEANVDEGHHGDEQREGCGSEDALEVFLHDVFLSWSEGVCARNETLPYSRPEGKDGNEKARAKSAGQKHSSIFIPKRIRMFSANDSWLSSFIPGRSSDLAIIALRRLPGQCPVTYWRRTSALQRRVRAGFAPASLFTRALPRTPRTLCSLGNMIAHILRGVKMK